MKNIKTDNKEKKTLLGRKLARQLKMDESNMVGAGTSITPDRIEPKYERIH
ncbi:hypothetical protein KIH87_00170 [Paraneptunicella aestuarii]|uniref:hypothetical protein n=1 Tax=Paraneptunicella aestuarii TaxID=2831148 RepID=UPI001E3A6810|nr:hypothetical protein [Paraneptunicella aestuarii]UAA38830.1 hypothetical protein KIH87_00170 [Paraneptunicella aestuarii]